MLSSIAMMAMTTTSSIRVKPRCLMRSALLYVQNPFHRFVPALAHDREGVGRRLASHLHVGAPPEAGGPRSEGLGQIDLLELARGELDQGLSGQSRIRRPVAALV